MLVLPRKRSVIQLFESQYFYDSVCGDLRAQRSYMHLIEKIKHVPG